MNKESKRKHSWKAEFIDSETHKVVRHTLNWILPFLVSARFYRSYPCSLVINTLWRNHLGLSHSVSIFVKTYINSVPRSVPINIFFSTTSNKQQAADNWAIFLAEIILHPWLKWRKPDQGSVPNAQNVCSHWETFAFVHPRLPHSNELWENGLVTALVLVCAHWRDGRVCLCLCTNLFVAINVSSKVKFQIFLTIL